MIITCLHITYYYNYVHVSSFQPKQSVLCEVCTEVVGVVKSYILNNNTEVRFILYHYYTITFFQFDG